MSEAATETICDGATSMYCTSSGDLSSNSFLKRHETRPSTSLPFLSICAFACAMTKLPSSIAERKSISFVTFPFMTFL